MARMLGLLAALALLTALPATATGAPSGPARATAAKPSPAKPKRAKRAPRCTKARRRARRCGSRMRCRRGHVRRRSRRTPGGYRCVKRRPRAVAPQPPAPSAPPAKPRRWTSEEWTRALSEPRFKVADPVTHYIEGADGTQLSLTVHLPEDVPPGSRIPTLLQLTPYRPLDQADGGYADFTYHVERGAAYVEADERGTGGSAGCLDFGGSADRADAIAFAEWIRSQPWSNGRIVSDGISHPGMGSVVAHAAIPGLTGALAHAPVVSYYQDEWLQGAKFEGQNNGPTYQGIELAPPLPPEFADPDALKNQAAPCTGQTTADFTPYEGPFGPLWADRDLSRHAPAERKPILLTHGFVDLNVHPDHSQLYWDALPADYPKYAVFGWWYHGWPDLAPEVFKDLRHRWMDWLLLGRENGMAAEPRVLVEDSKGRWHEGENWPLEQTEPVTLHTSADGRLSAAAGPAGTSAYPDLPGARRGTWEGAHVAFRSEPLTGERMVNGAPTVELVASSSATSTKWVAYLMDEAPDGTWQRVSHGYADSHTWKSEDTWLDLEPGKPYRWTLRLMPTAVVLDPGHRLTLVIASQDSSDTTDTCFDDHTGGCYEPSGILPATTAGRATNTVHSGPEGTRVHLAWADPARTQRAPYPAPP